MIDIVAQLAGPLAMGSDTHAPIQFLPGGSAANTACWLAAEGVGTTIIGRIGDDVLGMQARTDLEAFGVACRLQLDVSLRTGVCIVLVGPDGERTMVPDPGANSGLRGDLIDHDALTPESHLHISGYALLGGARPAAVAALALARSAEVSISVDAASAAPLADSGPAQFLDLIGDDLLLFANAAEARVLTGSADPRISVLDLASRVGWAAVKAGADGAYFSDGTANQVLYCPAIPLTRVVDTTGAGDAFAAAFLASLSAGDGPDRALQHAVATAAVACALVGGRPSQSTRVQMSS
jgi:sugar/nucleoside kinase (ribokinase family)